MAETGHARNVEHFQQMISFCTGYGTDYDPTTPEDESKGNSVSHRSYVQVAEAFGQMIKQLDEDPLYSPNENALKITTLTTLHTAMENANSDVITAATPMSNARIERNAKLYGDDTGVCDRAAIVKKYVKSLYGADSPQYKQIIGLEFRKVA